MLNFLNYPVRLTDDEGTVLVSFVDVPEAITFGVNEEDALRKAAEALATGLSFYVDAQQPLPVPSEPRPGQKTVRPGLLECIKLGLYQLSKQSFSAPQLRTA